MKFKCYYIVYNDAVVSGPYMSVEAAFDNFKKLSVGFKGLCKIMRAAVEGEIL
jgi:hypothetical protein